MKKVIYVAGPYRADSEWQVVQNIRRAEEAAMKLWRAGWVVICPHKNTAFFGGYLLEEVILQGDLELLRRCDAIFMVEGWESSLGAKRECGFAVDHDIPVIETGYEAAARVLKALDERDETKAPADPV